MKRLGFGITITLSLLGCTIGIVAQNECFPPDAEYHFEVNDLSLELRVGSLLNQSHEAGIALEYPPNSNKGILYGSNLWMGGIDEWSELRVAAQTFREIGNDFFAGPINDLGTTNQSTCNQYDRFWTTSRTDIDIARTLYVAGNLSEQNIPESVLQWPGRNNPYHSFELPTDKALAPFFDLNGDGNYNPIEGDLPSLQNGSTMYADQMTWYIYNDVGNAHTASGGLPLGMEIGVMVYAYQTTAWGLHRVVFYNLNLNYLGNSALKDFYTGIWIENDLGNYIDDFVGCDPTTNLAYAYNGDTLDEGTAGYGSEIPSFGIKILRGLQNESGQDRGMSTFANYLGGGIVNGYPSAAHHFYNLMQGKWRGGEPMTYGGNGLNGDTPTNYLYSAHPMDPNGWSECASGNTPADRRFFVATGPIDFAPQTQQQITFAFMVKPESGGCPYFDATPLIEYGLALDAVTDILPCSIEPQLGMAQATLHKKQLTVYPNPMQDKAVFDLSKINGQNAVFCLYNTQGNLLRKQSIAGGGQWTFERHALPSGIYLYHIESGEDRFFGKLKIN